MDDIASARSTEIDYSLSAAEAKLLHQFVDVGHRAKQVLMRCESSHLPTLPHLLHNYTVIRNIMRKRSVDPGQCGQIHAFCKEIAERLLFKFDPIADRAALLAAVLEPRYHELRFLGHEQDKMAKAIEKEARQALKKMM